MSVTFIIERRALWRESLAAFAGMIIGFLARPNPLGAARLLFIQLFQLAAEKGRGTQLLFGEEIRPLTLTGLAHQLIPLLLLAAIAAAALYWLAKTRRLAAVGAPARTCAFAGATIALICLGLAFTIGARMADLAVVFGMLGSAIILSWWMRERVRGRQPITAVVCALALLFAAATIRHGYLFTRYLSAPNVRPPTHLAASAQWLAANSNVNEIVFHTSWDSFPFLFFSNQKNRYISGHDPIFGYAFSPARYWQQQFIALSGKPYACPVPMCTSAQGEELYTVFTRDFGASYVVIERDRNAGLAANLAADERFTKVFEAPNEVVYRIN